MLLDSSKTSDFLGFDPYAVQGAPFAMASKLLGDGSTSAVYTTCWALGCFTWMWVKVAAPTTFEPKDVQWPISIVNLESGRRRGHLWSMSHMTFYTTKTGIKKEHVATP